MKGRKESTKEEDMTKTSRRIRITRKKVRNIVILMNKKLILNLKVMMMNLFMLL